MSSKVATRFSLSMRFALPRRMVISSLRSSRTSLYFFQKGLVCSFEAWAKGAPTV